MWKLISLNGDSKSNNLTELDKYLPYCYCIKALCSLTDVSGKARTGDELKATKGLKEAGSRTRCENIRACVMKWVA